MARPGRTQRIAVDETPLNAATPDLRARLGHGHPAGADLEVDGGGADAHERGAQLALVAADPLAVLAVAERAADQEELTALLDQLLVALAGLLGGGR